MQIRGVFGLMLAAITVVAACGESSDDATVGSPTTTMLSTSSTTDRTTTTTSRRTTTTEPAPPPFEAGGDVCRYLENVVEATASDTRLAWAQIGQPPDGSRPPVLVIGWYGGVFQNDEDEGQRKGAQLRALVEPIRSILLAEPDINEILVVFTGTSYEASFKDLYLFEREVFAAERRSAAQVIQTASVTEDVSGNLPLTLMSPDRALLDEDGRFLGPACV